MSEIKTYTTKEEKEYIVEEIKKAILNHDKSILIEYRAYIRHNPHRTNKSGCRCRDSGGPNCITIRFAQSGLDFKDRIKDKSLWIDRIENVITKYKLPVTISVGENSKILGGSKYIAILFTEPQWKE